MNGAADSMAELQAERSSRRGSVQSTNARIRSSLLYRLQRGTYKILRPKMNSLPVALQPANFINTVFDHQNDRLPEC